MADQVSERMVVRASPARCWEVVLDFERYPEWAADVREVEVLERDEQGRGTRVRFRTAAFGWSTGYTLVYDYSDAPRVLSWRLEKGDIERRLDGSYAFEESGGDTEITYHLVADLVVPVPGFVKRRAEGRITHTALKELKARAEEPA